MVDIEALKASYLNLEFDRKDFTVAPEKAVAAARLVGETASMYVDPDDPAFNVHPAYVASLSAGRHLPIDFPNIGGLPVDGGKAIELLLPVPAGIPLTGKTHLHDIFDKSGRSGRMIFLVSRMELFDDADRLLAINDARMIIRERNT